MRNNLKGITTKMILEEKKILSFSDKELIEEKFALNLQGITAFAGNILDSASGLLIKTFGTKIVGAFHAAVGPNFGRVFTLPVETFNREVEMTSNLRSSTDQDLIKVYDDIEDKINKQMANIKSRGSLFAYLNSIKTSKPYLGILKGKINTDKIPTINKKINFSTNKVDGKTITTMDKGVDLIDLINKGPKALNKALNTALNVKDEAAKKVTIDQIIKAKEKIKSKGELDELTATLLDKYNINNYKTINIGGKLYTDLDKYIVSLLHLSTTNKEDLKDLGSTIKDKLGQEISWDFLDDGKSVSTARKSNFSWVESQAISSLLIPRFITFKKMRDKAVQDIKRDPDSFVPSKDRFDDKGKKKNRFPGTVEPKRKESNIILYEDTYNVTSFSIGTETIKNDVVGKLISIAPIDGSAKEFIRRLAKGQIAIDFIFDQARVGSKKYDTEEDKEADTIKGVFVSAKIHYKDLLIFFQKIMNKTNIDLISIIKRARNVNKAETKDGEEIVNPKRPVGRPKKNRMNDGPVTVGGFRGSGILK